MIINVSYYYFKYRPNISDSDLRLNTEQTLKINPTVLNNSKSQQYMKKEISSDMSQ